MGTKGKLRMSSYSTTGTILRIEETKQVSEKFRVREFVLNVPDDRDSRYDQTCQFQMTGDRCEDLDRYSEGDEVTLHWGLRGREWTNREGVVKVFNSLNVFKLEATGNKQQPDNLPPPPADDDIPF